MNKFRYISVVAAFVMAVSGSMSCSNENKDAGDISIGFGQDTYKFKGLCVAIHNPFYVQ